jgi:hypothetical protein
MKPTIVKKLPGYTFPISDETAKALKKAFGNEIVFTEDANFEIITPKELPMPSNLKCISEHTVDLSLITRESKVLDLGCRAFSWSKAMLEYVDEVYCLDADPDVKPPEDKRFKFINNAISTHHFENLLLSKSGNGTGNFIEEHNNKRAVSGIYVTSTNLETLTKYQFKVEGWDVIKFDVEGSEIPVLLALKEPPAKQLSIEFHLHTGSTDLQVQSVFVHLEHIGYKKVFEDYSAKHGCGVNYWDVLFVDRLTTETRLFKRNVGNYK